MPLAPRLTVLHHVAAPIEATFALWTDLHHVTQWWAGPGGRVVGIQFDAWPGGQFWVGVELAAGAGYVERGRFRDVIEGEALLIDWEQPDAPPADLVLQLRSLGPQTEITITQRGFATAELRDVREARWRVAMAALDTYIAELSGLGTGALPEF